MQAKRKYKLNPKLKEFQKEAVAKAYNFIINSPTHSCYNANSIGSGKSVITIEVLNALRIKHDLIKTLIVCPACMLYTWEDELERWLSDTLSISVLDSSKKYNEPNLESDICVTSYGLLRGSKMGNVRYLGSQGFDNLVFDEAHNLKNTSALQTKAAFYIWECVKTRQALTGTPFVANIVDGYSLFHRMCPKYFPDFKTFVDRYSYKTITPWSIKYFGVKHPKELRRIIRKNFYFRYTLEDSTNKEDLLEDVSWVKVTLPDKYSVAKELVVVLKNYEEELSRAFYNLDRGLEVPVLPALATHIRLQGEKIIVPITEFSTNILGQGESLIIFAWHKATIAAYKEKLSKYNPGVISGATPIKLRSKYIKEFQSEQRKLLIIQIKAGGVGITLTAGHIAVFAELTWNPTDLSQAVGRLNRIGQTKKVLAYYFCTKNSIDERIINVIKNKTVVINKVT